MNAFSPEQPRPLIGITPEARDARGNIILPSIYADAVARAGGLPLILPVWQGAPAALLALCNGLILAGGSDIDPTLYNGAAHPEVYDVDRARDEAEIALVHLAVAQALPVLAICRGAQVVNVALGGTLHAHIPDIYSGAPPHRAEPYGGVSHAVDFAAGTQLAQILGADTAPSAPAAPSISWHHQAIATVAPGLRVAARAADGCIEAVEMPNHPWLIGVQWHPEMTAAADPAQQRLFDALIAACRARMQRHDGVESRQRAQLA